MQTLLHTIQSRPYVFVFLLTFLILSTLHIGVLRTLIWLLWGYAVAWVSEFSSIHNGFPYGLYHYIESAFAGELSLGGVPVWDSLSYTFLAYASFALSWFLVEPKFSLKAAEEKSAPKKERRWMLTPHVSPSHPLKVSLLAALLMMAADMVIDPVANMGEKWFLGKIYFYPEGGIYFGVPLSNFVGWFFVGLVIIAVFQILEKFLFARFRLPTWGTKRFPYQALLGPAFYFGIVGFALAMTFLIGAYELGAVSLTLVIFLMTASFQSRRKISSVL